MSSPSFRPATSDDIPRIAVIHVAAWEAAYRGLIDDEALNARTVERRTSQWKEFFTDQRFADHSVFVAEVNNEIVGFAHVGPSDDDDVDQTSTMNVFALYLDPSRRGRGLGRALLDHVGEEGAAAGYKLATLYVLKGNDPASRFYEKLGWEPQPEIVKECLGDGHEAPQFRFRRALVLSN